MSWVHDKDLRFKQVYDEVFPIVLKLVWRVTGDQESAEELCQDAFIKLYERLDNFPDNNQAKYWMIRVAKNHALNYVKRKQRERHAYEKVLKQPERILEDGEGKLIRAEEKLSVQLALEKLPPNMKEILVMKEYGEMNYRDIGKVLGISEANVKVRMFRARQRLLSIMEKEGV